MQVSTVKYFAEHCMLTKDHVKRVMFIDVANTCGHHTLTTSDETLTTTPGPRKIFAIESCCDATHATQKIPLENSKLHFPLLFNVSITN